ncbi:MAG: hypothetical protein JXR96_20320 [Deltaproteobacteria bacterium]|nr:hypothetical protein [Deltaproteobacteria bacterium]
MLRARLPALLAASLLALACGQTTRPDGACVSDYDCEPDQLCGADRHCLLCTNCDRGRVGTCMAPVWPLDRQPDEIFVEPSIDGDVLVYSYACEGAWSDYRYTRLAEEACFETEPHVDDDCGFES